MMVQGNIDALDAARIERVYSGKPKHCMCGCAGKYYDTQKMKVKVAEILVSAQSVDIQDGMDGGMIFTAVVGGRQYTAYCK